MTSTKERLG